MGRKLRGFTDRKQIVARLPRAEEQCLDEIHSERTEVRNIVSNIHNLRRNGVDVSVHWVRYNESPEYTVTVTKAAPSLCLLSSEY